jgi:hypothetical protein
MKASAFVAVALTLLVVRAAGAAEPDLAKLSWLEGCWASDGAEPGSGERWMSVAGKGLLGISSTIRQGKTVESEHMEIGHLPDGRFAFVAHPSSQPSATFLLLRISETEVAFENLEHDFPQRIVYAEDGESKLRARIEGAQGGTLRVIEFPMTRTSCD